MTVAARLRVAGAGRAAVTGPLVFATAGELLPQGSAAILAGEIDVIDLAEVEAGDSAGLALLIEWLSVARAALKPLAYANVPAQLRHLAALSDADELIGAGPAPPIGLDDRQATDTRIT